MFFQFSLFTFLLLTAYRLARPQVPFPSHCPEVKVVENFRLDDYMGIWYEYAKYPFVFEIGKKCMFARYEKIADDMVSVTNAAVNRLTDESSNITGKAKVISSGALAVVFPRSTNQNFNKANYLVLGTDYTSFVVVYSCSNFTPIAHTKIVWILTRDRNPSESAISAAKKVMQDNQLSQTFLMETVQDGCPNITDIQRSVDYPLGDIKTDSSSTIKYDDDDPPSTANNIIGTA